MKTALRISIGLNVGLLGVLILALLSYRRGGHAPLTPVQSRAKSAVAVAPVAARPKPFRWSQLKSTKDYRTYVANLRAIGCPEATIRDIVRGDAERAFSFERRQLELDGSGTGPWSRSREARLVTSLLGEPSSVAETAAAKSTSAQTQPRNNDGSAQTPEPIQGVENNVQPDGGNRVTEVVGTENATQQPSLLAAAAPVYPLVFQNVNLNALKLSAGQKAAIAQVRQQFENQIGGPNQNPSDPTYLARWRKAQHSADDALHDLMGPQAYENYLLQLYSAWYQPQVKSAAVSGRHLTLAPYSFSK